MKPFLINPGFVGIGDSCKFLKFYWIFNLRRIK